MRIKDKILSDKISRATDDLSYRIHRLTLENLQSGNNTSIIIPQPNIIHGLLNQYDNPFTLTSNVAGLFEEWYRRGVITGINLSSDNDLQKLFKDRNTTLLDSFKEWISGEFDNFNQ